MPFNKYQHIERLNTQETEGILDGIVYIFPKLDGSNGSIWFDDVLGLQCGSRNQKLSASNTNRGFHTWVMNNQVALCNYFLQYPTHTLYGEWLVKHHVKYLPEAYNKFYIFDVYHYDTVNNIACYIRPEEYVVRFNELGLEYVPALMIIEKPVETKHGIYAVIEDTLKNQYLLSSDSKVGEGIVIKNYDFVNKYGRTTWAKVVNEEFQQGKVHKVRASIGDKELNLVNEYVTNHLVDKELAKLTLLAPETINKHTLISRMIQTVYYCVVTEYLWDGIKRFKIKQLNFSDLQKLVAVKVRTRLLEVL